MPGLLRDQNLASNPGLWFGLGSSDPGDRRAAVPAAGLPNFRLFCYRLVPILV